MGLTATRRGRRWIITGALAAALIGVTTAGLLGAFGPQVPEDMNGRPVSYELDAAPRPEASAVPDGEGSFVVSSVGLDVPLGALNAVDGVVTPPGFTSAYLIRDAGVTPDRAGLGTVFVVMHSLRGGATGPGNYLIDVDSERSALSTGASISVDGQEYAVTTSARVSKNDLAANSDLWVNSPGRLVVITCLQRPGGGASVDNIVIEAQLVSA